jgi:hypothetical protein
VGHFGQEFGLGDGGQGGLLGEGVGAFNGGLELLVEALGVLGGGAEVGGHLLLGGVVPIDAEDAGGGAAVAGADVGDGADVADGAVGLLDAELGIELGAVGNGGVELFLGGGAVFLNDGVAPDVVGDAAFGRQPVDLEHALVPLEGAAGDIEFPDAEAGGLDGDLELAAGDGGGGGGTELDAEGGVTAGAGGVDEGDDGGEDLVGVAVLVFVDDFAAPEAAGGDGLPEFAEEL